MASRRGVEEIPQEVFGRATPVEERPDVALGTALIASRLIASLFASFLWGIGENTAVPEHLSAQAAVESPAGSRSSPTTTWRTRCWRPASTRGRVDGRRRKRGGPDLALRVSPSVLALTVLLALFFTSGIPSVQPADEPAGTITCRG